MVDLLMLLVIWMIEGIGKLLQSMCKTFWVMTKITFWLITLPFRIIGAILKAIFQEPVDNMSGYDYEKLVAKKLLKDGFKSADVTQKSGDFGADIIAIDRKRKKVAVQCKKYSEAVGIRSVQEVLAAMQYYKCEYAMVVTNSTFTPAAKEMAKATRVILKEKYI